MGLQTQIINATTVNEINDVFAAFERDRPDALFVAADAFLGSRHVQLAILTARDRIPATYSFREHVEAGGLMSYGPDFTDMFRQVGVYTGNTLRGAKPAELPVLQSNKFELVINLTTAKALGLTIPPGVMSIFTGALTLVQGGLNVLLKLGGYPSPPKSFALILGPPKPGPDSFFDRCALELGKHAHHLKHGLAARRRGGRGIANPRFFSSLIS